MMREELITEIRKYRCSDLSDGMDALGLVDRGTMAETMRPIRPGIRGGVWGSEIAMTMMEKGIEGAVIDGGCRDSYEANLENAPVFCTRRTFTHAYGRVEIGAIGVPVECAGVTVRPGDIICADDDGVLVIPIEYAEDVIQYARTQLEDDIVVRTKHYENLGYEPDATLERLKD